MLEVAEENNEETYVAKSAELNICPYIWHLFSELVEKSSRSVADLWRMSWKTEKKEKANGLLF